LLFHEAFGWPVEAFGVGLDIKLCERNKYIKWASIILTTVDRPYILSKIIVKKNLTIKIEVISSYRYRYKNGVL